MCRGVSYECPLNGIGCCCKSGAVVKGVLFPKYCYAGGGVISCGGSGGILFSEIVSNDSTLNSSTLNCSCLYFRSGNGGFCFFGGDSIVLNCSPFSVLLIVVL